MLPPIPDRLQQIDQLTAQDHFHVDPDDECYHLWERVSGAHYDEYPTNDFIKNLQIETIHRGERRWYYKEQAINHVAAALSKLIPEDWKVFTYTPIPPSSVKDDPGHDGRLLSILKTIAPSLTDIRELVLQNENTVS
jgi:hypothetical protein